MIRNNNFSSEMQSLQQDYLQGLPGKLERIIRLHHHLTDGSATTADLNDYLFQAHNLAGSAAMYGLVNVGHAAKALENLLSSITRISKTPSDPLVRNLNDHIETLLNALPCKD